MPRSSSPPCCFSLCFRGATADQADIGAPLDGGTRRVNASCCRVRMSWGDCKQQIRDTKERFEANFHLLWTPGPNVARRRKAANGCFYSLKRSFQCSCSGTAWDALYTLEVLRNDNFPFHWLLGSLLALVSVFERLI